MKLLGLELAPLSIPFERRLQTFAVFYQVVLFLGLGFFAIGFMVYLLFTSYYWLTMLYMAWYCYDFNQSSRGGRRVESFRKQKIWTWYRDYFPVRLITTTELDPEYNYVFGSHPHGVMGLGAFTNYVTDVNGFSDRFPGITMYPLSLKLMHQLPLLREYVMAMGICDVSKESIRYLMQGKGRAILILIGGAKEALDARPGLNRIVLKGRKGFVKIAIQYGAHLVPSYTFGENELYRQAMDNPPGSKVRAWQRWFQLRFGIAPILFYGRGIFNYTFGILPHRIPLTTIVGRPILVEKNSSPSQEYIDEIHERYIHELKTIFDNHKAACGYPKEELEIAD